MQTAAKSGRRWELVEVPCDYCGSDAADVVCSGGDRLHGLPGRFSVVVCRQCGLARTNPQPTPESLATAYPESYPPHQGKGGAITEPRGALRWMLVNHRGYPLGRPAPAVVRWIAWPWAAWRLRSRRLLGYLPYRGEGRLLDFGCGTGKYVRRIAAAGWQAEGLDASEAMARLGRESGVLVHTGTLPGAPLPGGAFDAITMWASLEHVPSPMATLKAARDLLRPAGWLMVAVPLADSLAGRWFGSDWYGFEMPRHLTHFTKATMSRHLQAAGFRVEKVWPIRRPSFIRESFKQLADESGRSIHRRLARSRFVSGCLACLSLLAGRTDEAAFLAVRT